MVDPAACAVVTGLYTDAMKAGISAQFRAGFLRAPITRTLMLSAALHLAFAVLFQTGQVSGGRQVVLINARLLDPPTQPVPVLPELLPAVPVESPTPPDQSDIDAPVPLLTAMSPSTEKTLASESLPVSTPAVQPEPVPSEPKPVDIEPHTTPASMRSDPSPVESAQGASQASALPSLILGIDTHWYLASQVDVQPKAIGRVQPLYPEQAKKQNIEGTLKLMLKIDDLGRVQSAEVVEAIPPGMFEEAALAAFSKARFVPAIKDGRPVRLQAYIRVDFKLKD
jgi:protein TonB